MKSAFAQCLGAMATALVLAVGAFAAEQGKEKKAVPGVRPLADPPGIHNFFSLGDWVYSGSSPEGEKAFAELARLGIKTIVTVDGAKPDVELARKHGLRYVHLPHGYDGISTNLQLQLAKLATELPGPFYVHCHHGKHRGPAAAAVICMTRLDWSRSQAENWMVAAGTSTNYAGLYATVREFKKPSAETLRSVPSEFPAVATVSGLTDSMVEIDAIWERLKKVRNAGYRAPKDHPDLQPANEALLLWEQYREGQRLKECVAIGPDFVKRLNQAELEGKELERLLRLPGAASGDSNIRLLLDRAFDAAAQSCTSCHRAHRDVPGVKASNPLGAPGAPQR